MRTYNNPVQRGFFPDPSVVRVGEDYYMVNSSFEYFPAIPISHSRDLVHWEIIGHAITNPDYLDLSDCGNSLGIWAPDIEYVNGRFVIMATYRLNADGKRGNNVMRRQLMMSSERPEGPYTRPVCLEVDDIDPSIFVDRASYHPEKADLKDRIYMVIAAGVRLVPLSDDMTRITGPIRTVWPGTGERCPEGPHILYKDGYYYAILAEGGTGYGHGINVARSRDLMGPYEPSPYNPVLRQKDPEALLQRCGHGKLIEDTNGDWWCFYLCARPNRGRYSTIGRETALEPVTWTQDGWFVINGGKGPSLTNTAPDLPEQVYERRLRDDFDGERPGPEWLFVRRPDPGSFSLTERPGYFRIWTRDGHISEIRSKNTLLRREQEPVYEAETRVEFYPDRDGEQAGLICFYSNVSYIRLAVCHEGGRKLQLVINRNNGEELIGEVPLPECTPEGTYAGDERTMRIGCPINDGRRSVWMKVRTQYLTRTFYYSLNGRDWTEVGRIEDCIFLCDEGIPNDPKRHTGTLVGIYADNGGCGTRKAADFDYFAYNDEISPEE